VAEYVEYGSLASVPGPLHCQGVTQWCFPLKADPERLTDLCSRVFAGPSASAEEIRPLGSHVTLTLGRIERIVSEQEPFTSMGWAAESQAAVWIPVGRVHIDGERPIAQDLLMFTPFMWVDNPISLVSGREMYGFPKAMGWFDLPAPGAEAEALGLDVFGMQKYDSDEEARRQPLVRITRGPREHELADVAWSTLLHVGRHLRELAEGEHRASVGLGWEFAEHVVENLRAGNVKQLFLRQARAIEDGALATLQQVTEASYHMIKVGGAPLGHEYHVELSALASHPLVAELGVTSQSTAFAFRTESEFVLERGSVIWPR